MYFRVNIMGKKTEAQQKILKLLHRCGELEVADAVAALNVSEATVRRHFAELESQGSLIRVFGGVRLPVADASVYLFQSRSVSHLREKRSIGRAAAALISDRERLFCDSGTTVLAPIVYVGFCPPHLWCLLLLHQHRPSNHECEAHCI